MTGKGIDPCVQARCPTGLQCGYSKSPYTQTFWRGYQSGYLNFLLENLRTGWHLGVLGGYRRNTEEIENTVVKVGPSFPWNYWLLFSEQKYHLRCHLKSPHWWAQNDIDMTIVDIWILRWTDSGSGHYCYQQTWKLSQSFQTTTSWLNVSSL